MLDRPAGDSETPAPARLRRPVSLPSAAQNAGTELTGAEVLGILRRRKLPLLASILLIPLLAWLAIAQLTPRYTATGTLIYDQAEYKLRELQGVMRTDPITDAVMASQAEVLRGVPVVEKVYAQLNLHNNPEFNAALRQLPWWRRWFATAPPDRRDVYGPNLDPVRNAALQAVREALTVTPVRSSRVLEVSFTAEDPVIAAAAANAAMDIYVKSLLGAKHGALYSAHNWLEQRAHELIRQVGEQEARIAQYRAENGLVEGMHARVEIEQISLLTESLARARSSLAEAEGRLDAASGRAGAAAQAAIAPSVVQLRARRDQLVAQLTSMQGRLGVNHPDVIALRTQLAEADRAVGAEIARVVSATAAELRASQERTDTLQRNLDEARAQVQRNAGAQIPLNAMQRDMEASRTLLQAVLERKQETAQQAAIQAPDAHEISLALPPDEPSFPRTGPLMAAAVAFAVVFGILAVYLLELADCTFRSGEDVRRVLGLPCLALLPRISRRILEGKTIDEYAARKPNSPMAEQLRALRTGLSLWPDRPRIVAVTAARQKEGKTTVARALGRLAAMNGEKVIVIDCDIRQPASRGAGLVDYLQDRAALPEIIHHDAATGMASITSGRSETNALGLLMSGTMARLLQTLREDYDLVLLDTPPAQAITDARVVAGLAEATLFCVRWRGTPRRVALDALERLEEAHANVVGVALTQVVVNIHVRSGYADAEVYHPRYGSYFRE